MRFVLVAVVSALVGAAAAAGPAAARAACGGPRPAVATLQDRPLLVSGHRTTVAALARLRGPGKGSRARAERVVYAVRARLVRGRMDADGDSRIVLADPATGATITAMFPPHGCEARARAAQAALMFSALERFDDACAPLEYEPWTRIEGIADVTGVLFFPAPHAPPRLEPVLRFRLVAGGC